MRATWPAQRSLRAATSWSSDSIFKRQRSSLLRIPCCHWCHSLTPHMALTHWLWTPGSVSVPAAACVVAVDGGPRLDSADGDQAKTAW